MKQYKPILLLTIGLIIVLLLIFFLVIINKKKQSPLVPIPVSTPTVTPIILEPTPDFILDGTPYQKLPPEKKLELQTKADENVANIQNNILNQFPWYNQLPLQTKNYFVYFDPQQKIFIASIYPQKNSNISIENQVILAQEEIKNKLKNLGADTLLYNITWEIIPK